MKARLGRRMTRWSGQHDDDEDEADVIDEVDVHDGGEDQISPCCGHNGGVKHNGDGCCGVDGVVVVDKEAHERKSSVS